MPNFKPMIQGKVDNIRGLALPKIKQDKFSPSQLMAKINETKGAKEFAEDIGLNAFLEGKKSVTKKDVDDFITNASDSINLNLSSGTDSFKDVQMLGGDYFEYTESVYELPKTDLYVGGDISGGHFGSDRTLMHSRVTRRTLDDGDGGNTEMIPTHHIEEMQSDWHQRGRQEGYADRSEVREAYNAEQKVEDLKVEIQKRKDMTVAQSFPKTKKFIIDNKKVITDMIDQSLMFKFSAVPYRKSSEKRLALYDLIQAKDHNSFRKIENFLIDLRGVFKAKMNQRGLELLNGSDSKLADPKQLEAFYKLDKQFNLALEYIDKADDVMNDFGVLKMEVARKAEDSTLKLQKELSLAQGVYNKFEQRVEMGDFGQSPAPFKNSWQGRILTDEIQKAVENGDKYLSWNTGEMSAKMANLDQNFKSVEVRYTKSDFINKDGSNLYSVTAIKNDGITIKRSTDAKGLQGLVGKDYSKEAITRLEKNNEVSWMNKVELTDIVVPHTGRRILYDKVVVDVAKRMAKIMGTRPPMKSKVILKRNAVVPERGSKAKAETAEVWVMELPESSEKLSQLPLYMPSMMPMKKMPSVTSPLGILDNSKPTGFEFKPKTSRASQARDLEPDNPYFK